MVHMLWIIPASPLAGFLLLALFGKHLPRRIVAWIGSGSAGISAILALIVGISFIGSLPEKSFYEQVLWQWIRIGGFEPRIGFYLDALSLLMMVVVTFVAFWIHIYSTEFMIDDEGYSRFFAYMNLFVASMLILVLADNLLLLYLGWEGVGLCSYLLIGFWYQDPANGAAAQKAFIVTRVGDTAMAIGLFLIFLHLGTLDIQTVLTRAETRWPAGSGLAIAVAALLLGGALGKSAQLPLQTWLPDAMAGPTPVSALIHAATMVTAGVYLIARTWNLYALAPPVQTAVAVIGAVTLLVAGTAALVQRDIKRVLAYSTISQIGYMFLALGVGAWSAAMFHFMTHAFFKALLFLSAGAVIHCLHHEHDIFKMGGLRKRLPAAYWSFLIGGASLAGFPLITAGFYSKDLILWEAWSSDKGSAWLWLAGLAGAFITAIYVFRVIFVVFYGEERTPAERRPGLAMRLPLIILSFFAIASGFVETPRALGNFHWFASLMSTTLPAKREGSLAPGRELEFGIIAGALALLGIYTAYLFWLRKPGYADQWSHVPFRSARQFLFSGWGFDRLYAMLFVGPFLWIARINRGDFIDVFYGGMAALCRAIYHVLSSTETGRVRAYAMGIAVGSIILIAVAVLL